MRNHLRLLGVPADDGDTIVIHTGLTVTTLGHVVSLVRDETTKIATICVRVEQNYLVTGLEQHGVKAAADLLVLRARRFLGQEWRVIGWNPPAAETLVGA